MSARYLLGALLVSFALVPPATAAITVETASLGHKVEAWYAANDAVPVVDVVLSFERAGSTSDPEGKEGRAQFSAAMLSEGAGDLDALAFTRALEEKAITIEAAAYGDRMLVHVHALRDAAPRAGELLALALTKPRFNEPDVARIRTSLLSRLRSLQENPDYVAERAFDEHAFAGHPYARTPDGTAASIGAITVPDMRDYLGSRLTRSSLLVVASGDVDASLLKSMLAPLVDALPEGKAEEAPVAAIAMQGAGTSVEVARDLPQSVVVFGAQGVERHDKRFYAVYLLNEILGGNGLVSRLADDVRQKKGLVYGVSSDLDLRRGSALLRGQLASRASSAAEAIQAVKATLADMHAHGVSEQQCSEARTYVLGSFPLQLDSSNSVDTALLMMRIYDLGRDYLSQREHYFRAVRCVDINEAAKELLDPARFFYVTVGRPQAVPPSPNPEKKP